MHRATPFIIAIFALCVVGQAPAAELLPAPNAGPATAQEFLSLIKRVADSAEFLAGPDELAQLLHLNLAPGRSGDSTTSDEVCANASNPKATTHRSAFESYVTNGESWFKRRPEGVQIVRQPSPFGGAAGPIRDPEFRYVNARFTRCAGRYAVTPDTSSEVQFNNVAGFVCIRESDARAYLPDNSPPRAEHGVTMRGYRGKTTEEYGTSVVLLFEQGCATGIAITQAAKSGLRAQRAQQEFRACMKTDLHDDASRYCADSIADY